MSLDSSIEWTQATWNPVTGCTKISSGCAHCYAERFALRLKQMSNSRYACGFQVRMHPDLLRLPLEWKRPRLVFVNSMSDLFHESVPLEFIESVFATIQSAPWHTFQVLTKRARRLADMSTCLPWPPNLWVGVSVERQDCAWRVDCLREVRASTRFLSCEPLLGHLDLPLEGIQWVVVGGESGPGARAMDTGWVRSIRDQCATAGVPFFLKQLGGVRDKRGKDRALLDGRLWREMPSLPSL